MERPSKPLAKQPQPLAGLSPTKPSPTRPPGQASLTQPAPHPSRTRLPSSSIGWRGFATRFPAEPHPPAFLLDWVEWLCNLLPGGAAPSRLPARLGGVALQPASRRSRTLPALLLDWVEWLCSGRKEALAWSRRG
ncbi:hypothetical protein Acsp05_01140 [Actinokineospora sp. NBRC 105648]|nr:hypothetical protein Acsp05_01140 [Actinokineospora sp. NBRC 105648]